jgi:dolichyl-phosphate beta-glucosyltransferase
MTPDVSIVIPAYNESDRLGPPLELIIHYLSDSEISSELIIVDDGSSDNTADVAKAILKNATAIASQVIRYEQNRGKGFAVRTGLQAASAKVALFSDADLSTPISEMSKLVDPIRTGEFDLTFGSRALDRSLIGTHQPWRREQGGKVMNLVIRKMSGLPFADTQCGFKAFNLEKFKPLLGLMQIDRFGFDIEFLFVAAHNGLRLKEIPVRWNDVAGSKVSILRDTLRMMDELQQVRSNAKRGLYDLEK